MADDETAISFEATVICWRGPAPWFYAPVPIEHAAALRQASRIASYGWGVIPVAARIGDVTFNTSLFPKDATYLLPLKSAVRRRADITAGDVIQVEMTVQPKWD
jgi:hypothetical protein